MKFSEIIEHISKRGFVTRELWRHEQSITTVMFFGMDNVPWLSYSDRRPLVYWSPNLEEIKADDWIIMPYFWNSPKDNYLCFEKEALENLEKVYNESLDYIKNKELEEPEVSENKNFIIFKDLITRGKKFIESAKKED